MFHGGKIIKESPAATVHTLDPEFLKYTKDSSSSVTISTKLKQLSI